MMKYFCFTLVLVLGLNCSKKQSTEQVLHWPEEFKNLKVGDKVPLSILVSEKKGENPKEISWAHWGVRDSHILEIKEGKLIAKWPGRTKILVGSIEIPGLVQEYPIEVQLPPLTKITIQIKNQNGENDFKVGDTLNAQAVGDYGNGAFQSIVSPDKWEWSGYQLVQETKKGIWFKVQKVGAGTISITYKGREAKASLKILPKKKEEKEEEKLKVQALSPLAVKKTESIHKKEGHQGKETENPLKVEPKSEGANVVDLYSLLEKVKISEKEKSDSHNSEAYHLWDFARPKNLFGVKNLTEKFEVRNFPSPDLPVLLSSTSKPKKRDLGRSIQSENPSKDIIGVKEGAESKEVDQIIWRGEVKSALVGQMIPTDFVPYNENRLALRLSPEIRVLTPEFLTLKGAGVMARAPGVGIIQVVYPNFEEFFHITVFEKGPKLSEFHIVPSKSKSVLPVGEEIEFFPMGIDNKGKILEDLVVYWEIEESQKGVLSKVGENRFKALAPGRAMIKASVYGDENSHAVYPLDIVVPKEKKKGPSFPKTSQIKIPLEEDLPYFYVQ